MHPAAELAARIVNRGPVTKGRVNRGEPVSPWASNDDARSPWMRPTSFPRRAALAMILLGATLQAAATTVTLPLPWKDGMRVNYLGRSVQEDRRGGKVRRTETREPDVLRITEAGPGGFLQVWRTSDSQVKVSGDAAGLEGDRALMLALAQRFERLPMQAELDAQGNFVRLRNWQALGAAMREVMLPVLLEQNRAKAKAAGVDEATLRTRMEAALERITGEQALSSTLGRQAAVYNFFTGASLVRGKPVAYTDVVPSPWTADILPTRGSFELGDVNANTVTIRWKQSLDTDKGAELMKRVVRQLVGGDLPKGEAPPELSLSDTATVVMERRTGLPLRIVQVRRIRAGGTLKTTTWTLEKLPD